MADGQETEIVSTSDEPGTLQDVLDALNPSAAPESVSEVEGEPDAPETPEAERAAPAGEGDLEDEELEEEEDAEEEPEEDETVEAESEEAPEEEQDEEEGAEEAVVVTLGELEIEVDEEAAEAIHELQDRASDMDAKQELLEKQVRKNKMDQDQLSIMEDELRADPVGFLSEKISTELRAAVAEDLLLDDAVWAALADKVDEWRMDDSPRRVAAESRRADRAEFKNQIEERRTMARVGRENAWELRDTIKEMGQNLPDRARLVWERTALTTVTNHVRKVEETGKKIDRIDPEELDRVLADEIVAFGINAGEAPAEPGGKKKPANTDGERFRAKSRRRKKVASTAPTGAGAGPARREQYAKMSLGDALHSLKGR